MTLYILTASNFEDAKTFVPPRICGIFTRKQVAEIYARREVKQNISDLCQVFEIPESLLNLCFYEIVKEAKIVFDTSKKIRKVKVPITNVAT